MGGIEPYYVDDFVTLFHADARDVLPHINGDCVVTDPPYSIKSGGEMLGFVSPNWSERETHSRGYADHDQDAFRTLMRDVFTLAYDAVPDSAVNVAFCGNRTFHQMVGEIEAAGFQPLDVLVFASQGVAKSVTTLAPGHEIASLFRKPGKPRVINPDWTTSNRFDLKKTRTMVDHPTPKPLSWMEALVSMLTVPGDTVLDPFAGSGSTLLAARDVGRYSVGVEIEEKYCEIIAKRLEATPLPMFVDGL